MRRSACAACGYPSLTTILDLGESPLADVFPQKPTWEMRYKLDLLLCEKCGLAQLGEIVDDDLLFGKDYAFFTGSSPSLVEHYRCYAEEMLRSFGEQARMGVVDIASNDGTLLDFFMDAGCSVMGFDPALPPAEAAAKRGIPTRIRPFTYQESIEALNSTWRGLKGKPGLILANNVLAHVADPYDFLRGVRNLLHPDGVAVFEVQYFPDLLFGNEWDHIYHEHRTFLSLTTIQTLAKANDLQVVDVYNSPTQGGSIRVFLKHRGELSTRAGAMLNREEFMNLASPHTYANWQSRVDYTKQRTRELVWDFRSRGQMVYGYGASAKSSTFLNYCGFTENDLPLVVDTTPYKIGCYTPGTHIPIVGPLRDGGAVDPAAYLVLIWNYLDGVIRRERQYMEDGGKLIVAIPHPVVL